MRRILPVLILAAPILMVIGGVAVMLFTPDVVTTTQRTETISSHSSAVALVLMGGFLGLVCGMVADLVADR